MEHKKGVGSTKNGRDSESKRLGVKRADDGAWDIDAPWLENILEGSDVSDYESLQYFQRQLMDSGVIDRLVEMGVQENDTIRIGKFEFDYVF